MGNFSFKLDSEKIAKLKETFHDYIKENKNEYVDTFIQKDDLTVTIYKSGKTVFQGNDAFFYASAYLETGWSAAGKYSYFTKWLTDGIGTSGKMKADSDGNKRTTLAELYKYIKGVADKKVFVYEGVRYKQHVQVYPSDSGFELFYRK